ncbi:hypothetical protein Tco_0894330 [Tanacetum coccineum]|uniref:Uncharacterized protein n=1 Tax=Tanacetum coccineum TaxID=301880 RepID=A0ABQ5CE42_9ASTR
MCSQKAEKEILDLIQGENEVEGGRGIIVGSITNRKPRESMISKKENIQKRVGNSIGGTRKQEKGNEVGHSGIERVWKVKCYKANSCMEGVGLGGGEGGGLGLRGVDYGEYEGETEVLEEDGEKIHGAYGVRRDERSGDTESKDKWELQKKRSVFGGISKRGGRPTEEEQSVQVTVRRRAIKEVRRAESSDSAALVDIVEGRRKDISDDIVEEVWGEGVNYGGKNEIRIQCKRNGFQRTENGVGKEKGKIERFQNRDKHIEGWDASGKEKEGVVGWKDKGRNKLFAVVEKERKTTGQGTEKGGISLKSRNPNLSSSMWSWRVVTKVGRI